jgi:hypothetical protein
MLATLPPELLRQVFYFSRSPTAWIIWEEFQRRAQEQADDEEDLQWYYDEAPDQCVFGIEGDWW